MKTRTRRYLLLLAALVGVGVVATYAMHGYNVNIRWPRDIQTDLFGQEIASDDELIHREHSVTLFAQGFFRWEYRIAPGNPRVRTLCASQPVQTCHVTKSVELPKHVVITGELKDGFLMLEEIWY